jgi:photosystem II stability/assembly factor-like uncharacterized protein
MQRPSARPILALLLLPALGVAASAQSAWRLPDEGAPGTAVESDAHGRRALATRDLGGLAPSPAAPSAPLFGTGFAALGPFGGDVADVAPSPTSPSIVLAGIAPSGGTGGTLYRSTDAGATWTQVAALAGVSVYDIEFSSTGTAYIGTIDSIWVSTDGGATWTQRLLGIGANDQVLEVTLDPNDAMRIWVGVADALGFQTQNVLLSTNGGTSWSNRTPAGAAGSSCRGIALDPADSNRVFAVFGGAFGGGSAWFSSNGGTSWMNRSAGLPANPLNDVAWDGARWLVGGGQLFGSQFVGLWASSNDGVTWSNLSTTWPNLVAHDIEIDPANAMVIWVATAGGGAFRSGDGGATWTFGFSGTAGLSLNEISVAAAGGSPIYAGGSSVGVLKSPTGTGFQASSVGIGALNLESIAANPLNADELAVAFQGLNDGGVYTSVDGGTTWSLAALPGTRFNTVRFAPNGTLYAISDGPTTIAAEALYRRSSMGVWTGIGPNQGPLFESELYGLDFSETDPLLLVTGGADFGVAGFEPTVWVSPDGGTTWNKNYEGPFQNETVRDVLVVDDGTDLLMAACYTDFGMPQSGGALRSTNGGTTWTPATGTAAGAQCYALDASAFDPATLWLADDDVPTGAVYRSTDAGATWTSMGFSERARSVAADPLHPNRVFIAASSGARVRVSENGGATATAFDAGLAGAGAPRELWLARGACNRLRLATSNGAYGEEEAGCRLEGSVATLSISAGGTLGLSVAGGQETAGVLYLVLGSLTGTSPGVPVGTIVLPLVVDVYFNFRLFFPSLGNTLGVLDAQGLASASIVVPPGLSATLIGTQLFHAFGAFTLGPLVTLLASNPVAATFVP